MIWQHSSVRAMLEPAPADPPGFPDEQASADLPDRRL